LRRGSLAVVFCDLVDSTGIAARLDAEEWRDLVGAYLEATSTAVTEMGGKVTKKLRDGLMAVFGYPVAQEDDAERVVRAALAMQRSLTKLNRKNEGTGKPALAARVAISLNYMMLRFGGNVKGGVLKKGPVLGTRGGTIKAPQIASSLSVAQHGGALPMCS